MVDILERNDVDFYIREHKARFKQNYVVLDVIAFFALSFDPSDFEAFSRICYKTSGRIRRSMLEQISRAPLLNGETYFDRVIDLCEENQNTGRIRYVSAMIARLRQMHPAKAMDTILHQLGYLDYLEFSSGNAYSMQAQKLGILTSLASRVSTVELFLDRIDELDEVIAQHTQRTDSRLTLTTVHSAKGLEFDTVILLDSSMTFFPVTVQSKSTRPVRKRRWRRKRGFSMLPAPVPKRCWFCRMQTIRATIRRCRPAFSPVCWKTPRRILPEKQMSAISGFIRD